MLSVVMAKGLVWSNAMMAILLEGMAVMRSVASKHSINAVVAPPPNLMFASLCAVMACVMPLSSVMTIMVYQGMGVPHRAKLRVVGAA